MKTTYPISVVQNEQGSMTLLALLILVVMTIVGIGVLTSSTSDTLVAQNEDIYRQNFARAEAAVRKGAQELQDIANADLLGSISTINWLHKNDLPNAVVHDPGNWTVANSAEAIDSNCRYTGADIGFGTQESMDDTAEVKTKLYVIYGRSTSRGGEVILRIGYKRKVTG